MRIFNNLQVSIDYSTVFNNFTSFVGLRPTSPDKCIFPKLSKFSPNVSQKVRSNFKKIKIRSNLKKTIWTPSRPSAGEGLNKYKYIFHFLMCVIFVYWFKCIKIEINARSNLRNLCVDKV